MCFPSIYIRFVAKEGVVIIILTLKPHDVHPRQLKLPFFIRPKMGGVLSTDNGLRSIAIPTCFAVKIKNSTSTIS